MQTSMSANGRGTSVAHMPRAPTQLGATSVPAVMGIG